MNTSNESRKAIAKARLGREHIEENMLLRSQEEINQHSLADIESESRESMVKQRQHEEHTKETMLSRTEAQINQDKQ